MDQAQIAALEQRLAELQAMAAAEERKTQKPKAEKYDPTEGMSAFEKAAASTGAGLTDLWQGAKQRYTEAFGSDQDKAAMQEQVSEKRAADEKLFGATKGGKVFQAVGQAAPLLLVPGGQGAAARILLGAAGGALGGALQPTQGNESVLENTVLGGALGGAFPLAGAAWGAGRRMLTGAGAREAAAENIARQAAQAETAAGRGAAAAAGNAGRTVGREETEGAARRIARELDPQAPGGRGPAGIRMSAAQLSGDAGLAEAENLSRMRYRGAWRDFDEAQMREIADAVRRGTGDADQLEALMAGRRANYNANWNRVNAGIDPDVHAWETATLRQHLEALLQTPEGLQPSVEQTLRRFIRQIDDAGENFSPAHLKELRAQLSGKSNPGMAATDPARAAPRDNPAIIALKQRIDDALDASSGGAWRTDVVAPYRAASDNVRAAQAAQNIREVFFDPVTGGARKTAADLTGEVPTVTQTALNTALKGATNARTGQSLLRPESENVLRQALEATRRKEYLGQFKKAGTGGTGSNTGAEILQLAQNQATGEILRGAAGQGMPGRTMIAATRALGNIATLRQTAAEMGALQNPELMSQIMREVASAGREVTPAEARTIVARVMQAAENVGARAARNAPGVFASQAAARP